MLVYKMLSPAAIHRSASYIAKNNVLSTEQLTFNADKNLPTSSKMLQIPLLAASTVHADHSIVVKIAVGLDKTIGGTKGVDSDVSIMVSDGESIHGFMVHDIDNYPAFSPCFGIEGKMRACGAWVAFSSPAIPHPSSVIPDPRHAIPDPRPAIPVPIPLIPDPSPMIPDPRPVFLDTSPADPHPSSVIPDRTHLIPHPSDP